MHDRMHDHHSQRSPEWAANVLGLRGEVTESSIKAAFRKTAREGHPDKTKAKANAGDDADAGVNFLELVEARDMLIEGLASDCNAGPELESGPGAGAAHGDLRSEIVEGIRCFVETCCKPRELVTVTPTLESVLAAELSCIERDGKYCITPHWLDEVIHETDARILIVRCAPSLEENVSLRDGDVTVTTPRSAPRIPAALARLGITPQSGPGAADVQIWRRKGGPVPNRCDICDASRRGDVVVELV